MLDFSILSGLHDDFLRRDFEHRVADASLEHALHRLLARLVDAHVDLQQRVLHLHPEVAEELRKSVVADEHDQNAAGGPQRCELLQEDVDVGGLPLQNARHAERARRVPGRKMDVLSRRGDQATSK